MTGWAAAAATAALFTAASAVAAGSGGAIVAVAVLWLTALAGLRGRLASAHPRPIRHRTRTGATPQVFPTYQDVERRLWPAAHSPRMFDHSTRPLLIRVTQILLRDRAGVDLATEPERARTALGVTAWTLVDPTRPTSEDSRSAGITLEQINELLSRLEDL